MFASPVAAGRRKPDDLILRVMIGGPESGSGEGRKVWPGPMAEAGTSLRRVRYCGPSPVRSRLDPRRLAALLCLAALVPHPASAAEGSQASVGDVRLPSGLAAHYEYQYDRNALLDSRRAGDALIALTRAGGRLGFDVKTLKLAGEWFGPVAATCLGQGEGDAVLVGFEDGRVCRVDPTSLALDQVAKLPAKVQWVGAWKTAGGRSGLVAVVEHVKWDGRYGPHTPTRSSTVHDLASGRAFPLRSKWLPLGDGHAHELVLHATAILLDSRHRLWLGDALSDWGGWCFRVDLDEGRLVAVVGPVQHPEAGDASWEGLYGFVELPDGKVRAHGGSGHMGLHQRLHLPRRWSQGRVALSLQPHRRQERARGRRGVSRDQATLRADYRHPPRWQRQAARLLRDRHLSRRHTARGLVQGSDLEDPLPLGPPRRNRLAFADRGLPSARRPPGLRHDR